MFCKSCGTKLEEGYMVCPECGTRTGEGSGHCPSCGSPVTPGAGFCANCGAAFADEGVKAAAPVQEPAYAQPAPAAAPAPKANASTFNFGAYFKEFGDNFTGIFKKPDFIFDYGTCFTSVLVLLISFLPSYCYFGSISFHTLNVYQHTWFAGLFIILAFLFSVRRFLPHVFNFINSDPTVSKIALFIVPGLHVVAHLLLAFQTVLDLINLKIFVFPFIFGGFFILITIAEIAVTIFAFIKKNKASK